MFLVDKRDKNGDINNAKVIKCLAIFVYESLARAGFLVAGLITLAIISGETGLGFIFKRR